MSPSAPGGDKKLPRAMGLGHIVVVSHNFPIVGIVCRITGTHLNEYRNFLGPCGVSRLHRNGDGS
jgi:broad specificity phosphatase PhoE